MLNRPSVLYPFIGEAYIYGQGTMFGSLVFKPRNDLMVCSLHSPLGNYEMSDDEFCNFMSTSNVVSMSLVVLVASTQFDRNATHLIYLWLFQVIS